MGIVFGYNFTVQRVIPATIEECLALDHKIIFHALEHLHKNHSGNPWLVKQYFLSNLFSRQVPINLEGLLKAHGMSHFRYIFATQNKGKLNFDDINQLSPKVAAQRHLRPWCGACFEGRRRA